MLHCLPLYPTAHEMHLLVKTRRCFVGALPRDILVEELAAHFQQFGRVTAVELLHEKGTGKFLVAPPHVRSSVMEAGSPVTCR